MNIIYEDADLLVVVKPAGVPTQTKRLGEQDLVSMLKNYRAGKKEEPYIGVIHRLDQPVMGLVMFAKNPKAAAELSRQVAEKSADKCYYALVERDSTLPAGQYPGALQTLENAPTPDKMPTSGSKPTPGSMVYALENYLLKDPKTNTSKVVPKGTAGAKLARLTYQVLEEKDGRALLDIHLETGRHHQIRVQFSEAGLPLVGDRKYNKQVSAEPLALCSYRIGCKHPTTKKTMEFTIPNPFSLE